MKMKLLFIAPLLFWCLLDHGASGVDIDEVLLMEGDSVTLLTGVKTNQQDRIRWYFNDTRIALITGDLHKICTDVQCNEGTKRFRDRLELDHQTGSLTITNIITTDSGLYKLLISSSNIDSENRFSVTVYGVSAAEQNKMKRKFAKEGESVTLDSDIVKIPSKNPNLKMWYFDDTLIAEITGDQSKICTDDQCKERFRDRLKLDQTGSLTITNTTTTDSGLYHLQINSSRFSIIKTLSVTITAVLDSAVAPAVIAIAVVAVLLVAAAGVMYCCCRISTSAGKKGKKTLLNDPDLEKVEEASPLIQAKTPQTDVAKGPRSIQDETLQTDVAKRSPDIQTSPTNVDKEPHSNQSKTLQTDVAKGPCSIQAETQQTDVANEPISNQDETPPKDIAKEPRGNQAESLQTDVAKWPHSIQAKTLQTDVAEGPRGNQAESLQTDVAKWPRGNQPESLQTDVAEGPRSIQAKTLQTDVAKWPRGNQVESLQTGVDKESHGNQDETPHTGVAKEPCSNHAETPQADVPKGPCFIQVETPQTDVTKEPSNHAETQQTDVAKGSRDIQVETSQTNVDKEPHSNQAMTPTDGC